jgi:opacity protein-like surface antigen
MDAAKQPVGSRAYAGTQTPSATMRPMSARRHAKRMRMAPSASVSAVPELQVAAAQLAAVPVSWSWTGFFVGVHVGGAAGNTQFSDPFGTSIFGDNVVTPAFLAGAQIGYNWQLPRTPWVVGLQADLSWLDSSGTNTCLASSGFRVSANCQARPNAMADVTARVGWAYGSAKQSLLYVKGGAAFVHDQVDIQTNGAVNFPGLEPPSSSASFNAAGWIVGAGIEHAITPAWSLIIDYSYVGLAAKSVPTSQGVAQSSPPLPFYAVTPAEVTQVGQNFQEAKLGLNYRLGMSPSTQWAAGGPAFLVKAPVRAPSGWEVGAGARYFGSAGRFQKDLGSTTDPAQANMLNSRLTYDATANSAEFFGRIEAPPGIFLKGNVGAGSLANGRLNDEDWVPFNGSVAYSNTTAQLKGNISYATVDGGYDFLRRGPFRLGVFVGYNYYKDDKGAYGCTQIANQFSDCASAIPSSVLSITEDDIWQSLRIGFNGQVMIADRLKLEADMAYLPYVNFSGIDNHVERSLISPESGTGGGVQIEGILSYFITDQFSLGLGGRYWSMWTAANAITNFGGSPCPCHTMPAKTDLYGAFVQGSYKFDPAVLF